MTVIHKVCGTKLVSSGRGDFGHCNTCKKDVHHLLVKEGSMQPYPNPETEWR